MSRCVLENCEENIVEHTLSIVELTIINDIIKSYKIYPFDVFVDLSAKNSDITF